MNATNIKYDVIIIGGGTSGCSAAYNCAKNKLKTLLIEKNNYLGGLMTGGLVIPVMNSSNVNINVDFYNQLVKTAKKYNAQTTYIDSNDGWLNPEITKIVLEDMLTSDTISPYLDILFESYVTNVEIETGNIKKIVINSNILSLPIESKYYIDSTGSGEFSKLCGCNFLNNSGVKQKNSLRFILGNVDINIFSKFIEELDSDRNITNTNRIDINNNLTEQNEIHFTTASVNDGKIWALDKLLKRGVEENILLEQDREYFQIFSVAGSTNQVAFNCPRFDNNNNNPFKYSMDLINSKKAIWRLYSFVKKYFPGFQNAELVNIATITGIREQNRLKTKYIYKDEDLINDKHFINPVLEANYPVDIHSSTNSNIATKEQLSYQLPVESLMSADISNLFCTGKIVGAEFKAHSALRVQKSCMSMGEGVAKYIASLEKNK